MASGSMISTLVKLQEPNNDTEMVEEGWLFCIKTEFKKIILTDFP